MPDIQFDTAPTAAAEPPRIAEALTKPRIGSASIETPAVMTADKVSDLIHGHAA